MQGDQCFRLFTIFLASENHPVYYAIATDAYEGRRISTGVYLVLVSNDERIEKVKAKT